MSIMGIGVLGLSASAIELGRAASGPTCPRRRPRSDESSSTSPQPAARDPAQHATGSYSAGSMRPADGHGPYTVIVGSVGHDTPSVGSQDRYRDDVVVPVQQGAVRPDGRARSLLQDPVLTMPNTSTILRRRRKGTRGLSTMEVLRGRRYRSPSSASRCRSSRRSSARWRCRPPSRQPERHAGIHGPPVPRAPPGEL
jgi:hypothetical protein